MNDIEPADKGTAMNATVSPTVSLIAAMDENGLIGADGGMPWHVPGDLRHFKRTTLHKPVLMGRRTHESIGRALPQRRNLVLTRNAGFAAAGCERVATLDDAIALAMADDADELMVMGGAQVYAAAMPMARRLYITRIHARFTGDTWFPEVAWSQWRLVSSEPQAAEGGVPAHTFTLWQR